MSDTTTPKFVFSCMHNGPTVLFPDDELADLSCVLPKGHTERHQQWSDDGTVKIEWMDDWSFAEGEWRQEMMTDE